jgi:Zn-dependent M28 family amino/carboxypeptidase
MPKPKSFFAPAAAAVLAAFLAACGGAAFEPLPVTEEEVLAHIRFLSHDLLEGRGLGSRGIELAALYHEEFFRLFGLEPFFGSSYRQTFELRGSLPDRTASFQAVSGVNRIVPVLHDDFVVQSVREDVPGEISGELVYAGFLIQAPERNWDDIKGADLSGKILLCEINEPGNRPGGIFDGEDMTYYGRWPYKFEKAAELGAAGVLIIHNTRGAAYGWDVVRNSFVREKFFIPNAVQAPGFQGWIQGNLAARIVSAAGLDLAALREKAETEAFAPVPLGFTGTVRQKPAFRSIEATNVAGLIRAGHRKASDRTVVLTAHYDHLGKDESLPGDQIYNGAVDNCSASASLLALASYFAQRPEDLKINLVFAAVTAEEELMLGSEYFVRNLDIPNAKIAANINFEMTNVWGETEDVFAIGAAHSDLDEVCRRAAERLDLRYIPERNAHLGFFFRSDQISFARGGVPGVWLHQGIVSRGEDKGYALRKFEEYQKTKYHQVTDEIGDDWDLRGTLQIIAWAREIVRILGEDDRIPDFKPHSAFRRPGR